MVFWTRSSICSRVALMDTALKSKAAAAALTKAYILRVLMMVILRYRHSRHPRLLLVRYVYARNVAWCRKSPTAALRRRRGARTDDQDVSGLLALHYEQVQGFGFGDTQYRENRMSLAA